MSEPIRILIVDDQRLMRDGLRTLLEMEDDLRVVGEAEDGIQAISVYESLAAHRGADGCAHAAHGRRGGYPPPARELARGVGDHPDHFRRR